MGQGYLELGDTKAPCTTYIRRPRFISRPHPVKQFQRKLTNVTLSCTLSTVTKKMYEYKTECTILIDILFGRFAGEFFYFSTSIYTRYMIDTPKKVFDKTMI